MLIIQLLKLDYQLPLDVSQYLLRGDRLWIPVEITRIRDTFHQAWQAGLQQLDQLAPLELRSRLVDTAQAWQQFAATARMVQKPHPGKIKAASIEVRDPSGSTGPSIERRPCMAMVSAGLQEAFGFNWAMASCNWVGRVFA